MEALGYEASDPQDLQIRVGSIYPKIDGFL